MLPSSRPSLLPKLVGLWWGSPHIPQFFSAIFCTTHCLREPHQWYLGQWQAPAQNKEYALWDGV